MIYGDWNDYARERSLYPAALVKALDFLQAADWTALANGRYDIDGDDLYVNVVSGETAPIAKRKAERHFRYADVQYMISGEETMGVARYTERLRVTDDWTDRDALLFEEVENETLLRVQAGQFAVFMPHDVHRPGCAIGNDPQPVRKAIVKIATKLLLQSGERDGAPALGKEREAK
ncbi:MAG: YhcH/YjgK/YiaL family protein [Paenibacillaceae bacterium]|nr:YhcH/YjgK/YiaL family protein [Paenibacillaceae bacterium]